MKRLIVFLVGILCVFPVLSSCKPKPLGFTREKAATVIADQMDFTGGDESVQAKDYGKNAANYSAVNACLSRNIFDEVGDKYNFRPNDSVTKYELAKISLYCYAALLCKEVHYLEPGSEREVNDIADMGVEQRWYIYSALDYGFVSLDAENNFNPSASVSQSELEDTLRNVKAAAGDVTGCDYERYQAKKLENFQISPKNEAPLADKLYHYDATTAGARQNKLLLSSLEGVVNSDKVQLYMNYETYHMNAFGGYQFYSDLAIEYGYFSGYNGDMIEGVANLLEIFKSYLKTAVLFTKYDYTINVAFNIAAVKNAIVVTPETLELVKSVVPGITVIDVDKLNLQSLHESQQWSYEHCFPFLRRDILAFQYWGEVFDWARDYNVQMKLPTIWIAGKKSRDYSDEGMTFIGSIMQKYPANIPVWGFQPQWVDNVDQGMGEVEGVTYCGEFGKYTIGWDIVGNESFFTGIPVPAEKLKVRNVVKPVTYNPNKIYVAIVNSDAGDTPNYTQYGFLFYEWMHEQRGKIPRSYEYAVCNEVYNPLLTQYIFDTATDNDYLHAALSGLGYTWPFSSYGSKGIINDSGLYMQGEKMLVDYYIKTNEMMRRLGFNSIEIINHTAGTFWDEYDYNFFNDYIGKYLTNADFYMGDFMRLVEDVPADKQNVVLDGGKPMFHCASAYSSKNFSQELGDEYTQEAVDWLTNDILTHTNTGAHFYYCMAFTWMYGPNRSKMVMDALLRENPNYEFITMAQMNDLFRQKQAANR